VLVDTPATYSVVADTAGFSQEPTILDRCILAIDCESEEWDKKFRIKLSQLLRRGRRGHRSP
jgi:hypothetical protein